MNNQPQSWWKKTLIAGWVGASVLAAYHVSRPVQTIPIPSGWTVWPAPGPTLAVLPTPECVYAGGLRGLFVLNDDGSATPIEIPATEGSVTVEALLRDVNGVVWVGHNQGLSAFDDTQWTTLSEADGLPDRSIKAIAETSDGFLWVGTISGAVRLPIDRPWLREAVVTFTVEDGLLHEIVSAVVRDHDGGIWFGNCAAPAGGLSRLMDGRWQHWTPANGLPHADVASLLVTRDGRVWAGCGFCDEGGAAVFVSESGRWRLERTIPTDELQGPKVRSLYQDRCGRIWIGSEYDGLVVRHQRRTVCSMTPESGLPGGEVMSIVEDQDGAIWLGTADGVVRISPEAVESALVSRPESPEGANP